MLFHNYYFVKRDHYFRIWLGDGSTWIDGNFCTDPDEEKPYIFFKEYVDQPAEYLETAKKECADGCDANEDCKYAEIFWLPGVAQICTFWTKDVCEMKDDEASYIYKKQWDEILDWQI